MKPQPEFSRNVRIDTLGPAPRAITVEADTGEKAALAKRFDLQAVDRLSAEVTLVRRGEAVSATGSLSAAVIQSCVATGEPVPATLDERFTIVFRPEARGSGRDEEIELSEEECDVVFYAGTMIDLGEAVAETLFLALDPWPRSANTATALEAQGVLTEEAAEAREGEAKAANSPFAALKGKT